MCLLKVSVTATYIHYNSGHSDVTVYNLTYVNITLFM